MMKNRSVTLRCTGAGPVKRVAVSIALFLFFPFATTAEIPAIGAQAPVFTLHMPTGKTVHMSHMLGKGPLVLIVLRGYPDYQCPRWSCVIWITAQV